MNKIERVMAHQSVIETRLHALEMRLKEEKNQNKKRILEKNKERSLIELKTIKEIIWILNLDEK